MLSIFISMLVVSNNFQSAYVNIKEIQAIEVVDIDDNSGVLTITLKGNKEENLAFKCNDKEIWEQTKSFLYNSMYEISKIQSNHNLDVKLNKELF
tara:strand:+ start:702 stop:986 length:285 start_codon:yes stop_codon:yes gene_type:complete